MTDREIDALIAGKVMGWVLTNYESEDSNPADWGEAQNNDGWMWEGREGSHEAHEWAPTTSPADSKHVRVRLAELGYVSQSLSRNTDGFTFDCSAGGKLFSSCPWVNDGGDRPEIDWPTEEKAVAVCALLTVGIEIA